MIIYVSITIVLKRPFINVSTDLDLRLTVM